MPVIVVANPKGGVGKSTLATNVAGALAREGHAVMLGDIDRQQSSRQWLAMRPAHLPPIRGWEEVSHNDIVRPPKGTTHVVLDTPAGLHGKRLDAVLRIAQKILIPLQPSLFDPRRVALARCSARAARRHRSSAGSASPRSWRASAPSSRRSTCTVSNQSISTNADCSR